MSMNSDPASKNEAGWRNRILQKISAPVGAAALALVYLVQPSIATAEASKGLAAAERCGYVYELDPESLNPQVAIGQLLGQDGNARQAVAWQEVRTDVYSNVGPEATETGAVLEVVADVGVPHDRPEQLASEQAAHLTDLAAGELNMEVGGGPAETYQTAGISNSSIFVSVCPPGTSPPVNFNLAVRPTTPSRGLPLPGLPSYY
jgi:hypothetical protein